MERFEHALVHILLALAIFALAWAGYALLQVRV